MRDHAWHPRANFAQLRARAKADAERARAHGYAGLALDATTLTRDVANLERLQRERPLRPPSRQG